MKRVNECAYNFTQLKNRVKNHDIWVRGSVRFLAQPGFWFGSLLLVSGFIPSLFSPLNPLRRTVCVPSRLSARRSVVYGDDDAIMATSGDVTVGGRGRDGVSGRPRSRQPSIACAASVTRPATADRLTVLWTDDLVPGCDPGVSPGYSHQRLKR